MTLTLDSCRINLDARTVIREDKQLRLTGIESELLRFMAARPQQVLSREELYREVWKHQVELQTRTLDLAILRLRKKIERNPAEPMHIVTVYGAGYTYVPLGESIEPVDEPQRLVVASNLGRSENDFFGREAECMELDQMLDQGDGCVTVLGPPGTGKTRLVRHWARLKLAEDRFVSAWFCDLTVARSELAVIHSIAAALGLSIAEDERSSTVLAVRLGRAFAA